MTAIKGYLDLIERNNLDEIQINYLHIIDVKVDDLTNLTEQLFFYSKSNDLQNNLKQEEICLNNFLKEEVLEFYSLFKNKNITPKINIAKEKVIIYVNKELLKRVLDNLISNALKYGEDGIIISLLKDGTIIFKNKTNALDSTTLGKIFDRYYTVSNAKKGRGVGLAICKKLVLLMNGKISASYYHHYLIIKIKF